MDNKQIVQENNAFYFWKIHEKVSSQYALSA